MDYLMRAHRDGDGRGICLVRTALVGEDARAEVTLPVLGVAGKGACGRGGTVMDCVVGTGQDEDLPIIELMSTTLVGEVMVATSAFPASDVTDARAGGRNGFHIMHIAVSGCS